MKAILYVGSFSLIGAIAGLILYAISPLLAFVVAGIVIAKTFF